MRSTALYLTSCLLVAAMPLITPRLGADEGRAATHDAATARFPGWPTTWEGRPLRPRPLSEQEAVLLERFPGEVASFDDGTRQLLLRWIHSPTHDLHPASRCFRGRGYDVRPADALLDEHGRLWGRFTATRGDERLRVSERVHDEVGGSWPDASAWYWDQLFDPDEGPWWAVMIVEPERPDDPITR